MLQEIIKYFISVGFVTGAIVYLFKTFFEKWIENKKVEHQQELQLQLEAFRIEKEEISEQNKVRFSRLHEEKLIVIKELYKQIVDINVVADIYIKKAMEFAKVRGTNYDSKFYEEQEFALSVLKDYTLYSERNMIYFEEEFAKELQSFNDIVHMMMRVVSFTIENKLEFKSKDDEVIENYRRIMPLIKKGLEKRFREILG